MKFKRLSSLATASLLIAVSVFNIGFLPKVSAAADTCTWTGAGSDSNFSTAANWTGCDNGNVPDQGDVLRFVSEPVSDVALNNDLGVALGGIRTVVTPNSPNYARSGVYNINTVSFVNNGFVDLEQASSCTNIEVPRFKISNISGSGNVTLNSKIVELYGGVTLNVANNLTLNSGFGFGDFSTGSSVGGSVISASGVDLSTQPCGGAGGAESGDSIRGFTINSLVVQKGSNVRVTNPSYPITLGGGTGTDPVIGFNSLYGNSNTPQPITNTVSGNITLLDNAVFYVGDNVTVNVVGSITGAGKTISKNRFSTGILNITPASNNSSTNTGVIKNAPVTTNIADNSASGIQVAESETTVLNGTRSSVQVYPGGILKGTGTATGSITVAKEGIVAPGNSPGCLNSGDFTLNGTYQFEVGGTTACTTYDQIKVTGTVDITGATLEAVLFNGFAPTVGQSYVIIDNDAADAITGTFAGVAEGGTYVNQGVTYTVTYVGGDGNDVVLTTSSVDESQLPTTPDTGVKLLLANPFIALAGAALAAGALLFANRQLQPATAKRRK